MDEVFIYIEADFSINHLRKIARKAVGDIFRDECGVVNELVDRRNYLCWTMELDGYTHE